MDDTDRLSEPIRFPSGVRWEPTEYKTLDQTPYHAYLDKNEDEVREMQLEIERNKR